MTRTLILGASGGIGSALKAACLARGDSVTGLSRTHDGFDVTDAASVDDHLAPLSGFDLVIVATGALEIDGVGPEKTIRAIQADAMMKQFQVNALGPALVLRHAHRLLKRDGPSRCAVLSARVGSIGDNRMGGWISYRSSKAAVNQIVHTAAIELARTHKQATLIALHPGTVKTRFTDGYLGRNPAVPPQEAAQNILNVLSGVTPAETGQFFDWQGKPVPW